MGEIGADTALEAAIHEAAHLVVGISKEWIPLSLHVRLENERWVGECAFQKKPFDSSELAGFAQVSVAGCLAQAKYRAEETLGESVTFHKEADLTALVALVRDSERATGDFATYSIPIHFLKEGGFAEQEFDGAWLSGADAGNYRKPRKYYVDTYGPAGDELDRQWLHEVFDILDDASNWRLIRQIAEKTCNGNNGDPKKFEVSQSEIEESLSRSDDRGVDEDVEVT